MEKYKDDKLADELTLKMSDLVPLTVDPVCGMRLSPKTAAFAYKHEGENYYFCAPAAFISLRKTMNENKFIIAIVAVTLSLLVGVVLLAGKMSSSAKVESSSDAKAGVASTSYDWGKSASITVGAEAVFEIKSNGSQPLKLFNIVTSCACTTAQTIVEGKASPLLICTRIQLM